MHSPHNFNFYLNNMATISRSSYATTVLFSNGPLFPGHFFVTIFTDN